MPAKKVFTDEQNDIIHATALRVWKRFKNEGKKQEHLAHALGITQQSVSNLIKGTYHPGLKVAKDLAILDGKELDDLIGDYAESMPPAISTAAMISANGAAFINLDVCVQFHAGTRVWSPWTIAAARAGVFGSTDFPAPEWADKLDHLEKALERARKHAF